MSGAAGAVAIATLGSSVSAQTLEKTPDSTAAACVSLTPELTEGPYYIDDMLLRDDITEGREGIPLDLSITVIDSVSCEPLADAAVDIWHCDALGDYSGISNQAGNDDTAGETWMRGIQLTGENGVANIQTIYPGWYVGRCTHIHLKVHQGGTAGDGTYIGGTTAHTGQLFFDDELTDSVAQLEPYSQRLDVARTRNEEDGVLNGQLDAPGFLITVEPVDASDLSLGFTGSVTIGVDPSAESSEGPGNPPPGN